MKSTIRIGGASAVGFLIILGAFYLQNDSESFQNGTIVAAAPPRSAIETRDSDGDGIQDWEETLQGNFFETIATPSSTILADANEPYTPPTTLTGKFSEAFLKDYLAGKMEGQDFSDPSAFVGTAITAINQNVESERYSRLELTIIPTTDKAVRAYGNRVSEIMKTHSIQNENEARILQNALEADDPKMLDALIPIREVYTNTIADTLEMDVPEAMVTEHINLLNAYESILTDIEAMRVAFTDPLYSLARMKGYEADATSLFLAFQEIEGVLSARGVTYANDEDGAFFYLFKP